MTAQVMMTKSDTTLSIQGMDVPCQAYLAMVQNGGIAQRVAIMYIIENLVFSDDDLALTLEQLPHLAVLGMSNAASPDGIPEHGVLLEGNKLKTVSIFPPNPEGRADEEGVHLVIRAYNIPLS